jgi:TAZ zinc finger
MHQPDGASRERLQKQQRLLMFLRHCAKCKITNCQYGSNCETGKQLWNHITNCRDQQCAYPRCVHARDLLRHYQKCRKQDCPICGPIKQIVVDSSGRTMQPGPQNGVIPHEPTPNGISVPMHAPSGPQGPPNGVMVPTPSAGGRSIRPGKAATRMREEAHTDLVHDDDGAQDRKRSKQEMDFIKVRPSVCDDTCFCSWSTFGQMVA